jgi:hypothetical protein
MISMQKFQVSPDSTIPNRECRLFLVTMNGISCIVSPQPTYEELMRLLQRAEADKKRAEEDKQRAEEDKKRAEEDKQRAEEEAQRAEEERVKLEKQVDNLLIPQQISTLTEEDYENFIQRILVATNAWLKIKDVLISEIDVHKYVKAICDSYRTDKSKNPTHCTVSLMNGAVQAAKTLSGVALTAVAIKAIFDDKYVSNKPYTTVIVNINSVRDSNINKLRKYVKGLVVDNHTKLKQIQTTGGCVVLARTAAQINRVTPEEELEDNDADDQDAVVRETIYGQQFDTETFVVVDEADHCLGSGQGIQAYEQSLDSLIDSSATRGCLLLSATSQLSLAYVLRQRIHPERDISVGHISCFVDEDDPKRASYFGWKHAEPFKGQFFTREKGDEHLPNRLDRQFNNTCSNYIELCIQALEQNRMMMAKMCTRVKESFDCSHAAHAESVRKALEPQLLTKTALQIIVVGGHDTYKGKMAFRWIGRDAEKHTKLLETKVRSVTDENIEPCSTKFSFYSVYEIATLLNVIEQDAKQNNPHYECTLRKNKSGGLQMPNASQFGLLVYTLREYIHQEETDKALPIFIYGNTEFTRGLSLVSVNPYTDGTDTPHVVAVVTHVALNYTEKADGTVNTNHSNMSQCAPRFATTLAPYFHNIHEIKTIPILMPKDAYDIINSGIEFDKWLAVFAGKLVEFLGSLEFTEILKKHQNDENKLYAELAKGMHFSKEMRHFFGGKKWGHLKAIEMTSVMARIFYHTGLLELIEESGGDEHHPNVLAYINEHEKEFQNGVLSNKPLVSRGTKRKHSQCGTTYESLPWASLVLDVVLPNLSPKHQYMVRELMDLFNGGIEELETVRLSEEEKSRVRAIALPSYQLIDIIESVSSRISGTSTDDTQCSYLGACAEWITKMKNIFTAKGNMVDLYAKVYFHDFGTDENGIQTITRAKIDNYWTQLHPETNGLLNSTYLDEWVNKFDWLELFEDSRPKIYRIIRV